MNVLITDDEKLIAEDIKREVSELFPKAHIDTATSGEEALEYSDEKEYDVALLDVDMPGMDGLTLARKLVEVHPTCNIIFVTGYKEYALEAHELYCSGFLLKPVGKRKLKTAFENLRKPFIDVTAEFYEKHYSGGGVIGELIKKHREMRGISRQELADYMSVTRQTIYRWEQGQRIPDILVLEKVARYLGVELSQILKEEDEIEEKNNS